MIPPDFILFYLLSPYRFRDIFPRFHVHTLCFSVLWSKLQICRYDLWFFAALKRGMISPGWDRYYTGA